MRAQGQREARCCVTLAGSCRALAATNDVRASRKWIPLTPLLFYLLSVCICLSPRLSKHSLIMLPIERASNLNELPVSWSSAQRSRCTASAATHSFIQVLSICHRHRKWLFWYYTIVTTYKKVRYYKSNKDKVSVRTCVYSIKWDIKEIKDLCRVPSITIK